jgi:hypothetical protein
VDRIADLPTGAALTHRRRGVCTFVEMDAADATGGTAWVTFPGSDQDAEMVSTNLLTITEEN